MNWNNSALSSTFPVQNRIVGVSIAKLEALTLKFPVLITTIAVLNRKIAVQNRKVAVLTSVFPVLSTTIAVLSLSDRATCQSDRTFSAFN